jgi:GMP reductase
MRIEEDVKLDFSDVLIRPKRSSLSSRKDVSLNRTFKMKHRPDKSITGVPIIAANMDGVGTFEMADAFMKHEAFVAVTKHYSLSDLTSFYNRDLVTVDRVFYSVGLNDLDLQKLDLFLNDNNLQPYVRDNIMLCLDVANGYSQKFIDFILRIREKYNPRAIMAGNVVTAEMTEELILSGADIVKIGIGPGSACTTRRVAGVGYPQLSAIIECADAAHGLGGLVCSDGGCTVPGDFSKAFGAGADFIMAGGIFAGHDQGGGEVIDGKVQFYGMSSDTAMKKHHGGVAEYRASEGRTVFVPYKGDVNNTLSEILGGVRSCMTYIGAASLKEISKRCTFVRVNRQLNTIFDK